MKQYLDLMQEVLFKGTVQKNRTGIDSRMIPGASMKFDLREGFPAVTTKKLAFQAVKGELIGFLRGYINAAQFRELGCKIWDQNANDPGSEAFPNKWLTNPFRKGEDDLGQIYSHMWRAMPNGNDPDKPIDQIQELIKNIQRDPTSRRLIVSAWHPEAFDRAALPPCHAMFQVIIDQPNKIMHMTMYQRSCDLFLGVPFNIASYSLLLSILADITGYTPGTFTWFGADVHIYQNHETQCLEQLRREPLPLPKLHLAIPHCWKKDGTYDFEKLAPHHMFLENYCYHPPIKAEMAV